MSRRSPISGKFLVNHLKANKKITLSMMTKKMITMSPAKIVMYIGYVRNQSACGNVGD